MPAPKTRSRSWYRLFLMSSLIGLGVLSAQAADDPLPLHCGFPENHGEGTAPGTEDGNQDGQVDSCHGAKGDKGNCAQTNATVKCYSVGGRGETTCIAKVNCPSGGFVDCAGQSYDSFWAGQVSVNGQLRWYVQCQKDGSTDHTKTFCP